MLAALKDIKASEDKVKIGSTITIDINIAVEDQCTLEKGLGVEEETVECEGQ